MNPTTTVPVPAVATEAASAFSAQAASVLEVAEAYTVDSPEMYELAGEELRTIATRKAQLEERRLSITRPMDAAKRAVMDLFAQPLAVLEQAEGLLRKSMLTWKRAEDERARQAQAEAERKERERLAELDRQRREAEEEERKAREVAQAALAKGDDGAFTMAAQLAEQAAAKREEAEEAQQLAEVAPVHVPAVAAPKAQGIAGRKTWKAEVVNLAELVKGVAKALEAGDETMLPYLQADEKALGQVARALKGATRIPGVRVYAEESLAVRKR